MVRYRFRPEIGRGLLDLDRLIPTTAAEAQAVRKLLAELRGESIPTGYALITRTTLKRLRVRIEDAQPIGEFGG